jgi:Ca2+-binding RTX toxin-like protein
MSNEAFKFYPESDDIRTYPSALAAETSFTFVNKTNTTLKLYWVNTSGEEILYQTLIPMGSYTQRTNTTHAWSVRDADGNVQFKFYPSELGRITAYDGYQEFSATLMGTPGDDTLLGTLEDDIFDAGAGNDVLRGDEGSDTASLPGKQADYEISYDKVANSFNAVSIIHGSKVLTDIEFIKFSEEDIPLTLVGYEQLLQYEVTNLQISGDYASRVNLIFISEGYRDAERSKFLADATRMSDVILGADNQRLNSPQNEYSKFFNVYAVFVPSKESGIDDSLNKIKVDTVFNAATYGSDGRLGYGDAKLVDTVLKIAFPLLTGTEMIAGLMNTSLYAGGGGMVGWAAADNKYAEGILLHELGHSYAKLQDEYLDPALADQPLERISDSVHVSASKTELNWSHWLGYEDELGVVGAYEGGYYRETGVWRATETSVMRRSDKPFSAPQKEEYIRRFYKEVGDYLSLEFNNSSVLAKVVDPNVLSFKWTIDGKDSDDDDTLSLDTLMNVSAILDTTPEGLNVVVNTVDSAGMIRKESIIETTKQTEKITLLLGSNQSDRLLGTAAGEVIMSGTGNDTLRGLSGDDTLVGGLGDDILVGGSGNDYIDGGIGIDTAVLSEVYETYSLENSSVANSSEITLTVTSSEVDQLINVERLEFKDSKRAFDLDGNAGKAAKLLGAFLGSEGVKNSSYVANVLNLLDNGMPYNDLMQLALNAVLGENPKGESVIKLFYGSLTGQMASDATLETYGTSIDNGTLSTVGLALQIAEHELNLVNIDFIGISAMGIEYI